MTRSIFTLTLAILLMSLCITAEAQQPTMPKIGWLAVRPASAAFAIESFQREFSKLGYVDGKNIVFEYRYAEGKLDRLPALADELVRLKVDMIIAPNTPAAVAAKNATKTIPIVFIDVTDPTAAGCWLANDLSCSRKPFPSSPVLQCYGIHRIQAPRRVGKKANCQREN
jgi:putative tryptophan/tyrosine transport system substrate-binding protein